MVKIRYNTILRQIRPLDIGMGSLRLSKGELKVTFTNYYKHEQFPFELSL